MGITRKLKVASPFWLAHRAGIRDGKSNLPESDQHDNAGTYMAELEGRARALGQQVQRKWNKENVVLAHRRNRRWEAYKRASEIAYCQVV